MEIDSLDKHERWLNIHLRELSKDSQVQRSSRDKSLFELVLKTQAVSRREIGGQQCVFRLKSGTCSLNLFGEYCEQWATKEDKKRGTTKYAFRKLNLKLVDEDASELILIHWNCPSGLKEPYQPHIHWGQNRRPYMFRKVHFPMNITWNCIAPDNLDKYEEWLSGLILFLQEELPRIISFDGETTQATQVPVADPATAKWVPAFDSPSAKSTPL
ncbi:MAG: hypothetical protein PHR28_01510 [candidate division Zixibacteria bacterium]|nr:hypothetical protein [candidate division Zixibacteria bacterium]